MQGKGSQSQSQCGAVMRFIQLNMHDVGTEKERENSTSLMHEDPTGSTPIETCAQNFNKRVPQRFVTLSSYLGSWFLVFVYLSLGWTVFHKCSLSVTF